MVGGVIVGLIGLYSLVIQSPIHETEMLLDPRTGILTLDKEFTVSVVVSSKVAVNAFSGEIKYNPEVIEVSSIEYNTSIADLWVEEPWYSNGEGTIKFAGGTTRAGGFIGEGSLVEINFVPTAIGEASLVLSSARVFIHDGFGTEAEINDSVDALFTIGNIQENAQLVLDTKDSSELDVVPATTNFDLNNSGKIGLGDISVFMLNILGNNPRYDFNQDGLVNTADLSLLLQALE